MLASVTMPDAREPEPVTAVVATERDVVVGAGAEGVVPDPSTVAAKPLNPAQAPAGKPASVTGIYSKNPLTLEELVSVQYADDPEPEQL